MTLWLSGPLLMLVGYFLFGIVPLFVRLAHRFSFEAPSIVFIRFILACLFIAITVVSTRQKLHTDRPVLLAARGVFGGLAVMCFFYAVQETGAGIGALLNYTHSIWANVLSVLFMRQKPAMSFWLLLLLASLGLFLVIDPSFTTFKSGEMLGLLSGVLGGAAILCIKELRKKDSALTVLSSFSVVGLLSALPFIMCDSSGPQQMGWRGLCTDVPAVPDFGHGAFDSPLMLGWISTIAVGIFAFFGQLLFTQAYKNTSVQLGTIMSLIVPIIATLTGWLFLDEVITLRFTIGAAMILTACAFTGKMEK